jgi:hypothetical protein
MSVPVAMPYTYNSPTPYGDDGNPHPLIITSGSQQQQQQRQQQQQAQRGHGGSTQQAAAGGYPLPGAVPGTSAGWPLNGGARNESPPHHAGGINRETGFPFHSAPPLQVRAGYLGRLKAGALGSGPQAGRML